MCTSFSAAAALPLVLLVLSGHPHPVHGQACPQHDASCVSCLSDPACGAFYTGAGCFDRCLIADIPCYRTSPQPDGTPAEVCARAAQDEADAALCAVPEDCAGCTSTQLSGGRGTCAWFAPPTGSGSGSGGGFCGRPGCTMAGCGDSDPASCLPAGPNPTTMALQPAPANLAAVCSSDSLTTAGGIASCTAACAPAQCCQTDLGSATCSLANCATYLPCQALASLMGVDVPTGPEAGQSSENGDGEDGDDTMTSAAAQTIEWGPNPEPIITIRQCQDVTFSIGGGTHNLKKFNKKGRARQCDFNGAVTILDDSANVDVTLSGQNFLKRSKYFYGCDVNNHCDVINQSTMVEVIPKYTRTMGQPCDGSLEVLKSFPLDTIDECENFCNQKDDCMGFSYDPDRAKACSMYNRVPMASGTDRDGTACYAAATECPPPTAPHCGIDVRVTCNVDSDPTRDCQDYADEVRSTGVGAAVTTTPTGQQQGGSNVVLGDPCEVMLRYNFTIAPTTTEASTWTWALRTRKGDEPVQVARPREYSWLGQPGGIADPRIPTAGTATFRSTETVVVNMCQAAKYKTLAEAVVLSDSNTVCTGRKQYKLTVKDAPAPAPTPPPPAPTPMPQLAPTSAIPDAGCGMDMPLVGCVIADGQTGPPKDWENTVDCNDYVPSSQSDCNRQVRYTYTVSHGIPSTLVKALRYRDGSYWENNPPEDPKGNPRKYQEGRWGTDIATVGDDPYEINQWEGEVVNFCQSSSVETRFQFHTKTLGSGEDCDKSGYYTLTTTDQTPNPDPPTPRPTRGPTEAGTEPDCTLELSTECFINDDPTMPCEDYSPSTAAECTATAVYVHKIQNAAPFDSGKDMVLTSVTRNRPGDIPHGDDFDFDLNVPYTLKAAFLLTIKESPMINFCTDNTNYITTFRVESTPAGTSDQCVDEDSYTLDLSTQSSRDE